MMVNKSRTLPCCRIFDHIPSKMAVLTEAHQEMTDLTHMHPHGRESGKIGARMLQGCCILRCLGPEGANDGEQEQDTAMLPHIWTHSLRNGRFDRGTPANDRLNSCIRMGANLARWALECCRAAAYGDAWGLRAQIW